MSIPGAASPLFLTSAAAAEAAAYQIDRSIRINDDDTAYLNRTPSSTGNRKTWTWSGWVKRSSTGGRDVLFSSNGGDAAAFDLGFDGSHRLECALGVGPNLVTNAVFRDFSAWMHIVVALDTTQSTASNRLRIYVNGSEIDSFSAANYPTQNHQYDINNTTAHEIGRQSSHYFDGYLAEIHHVDGQQLAPTDFGGPDDNGVWQPKAYSGTYGTNGFKLDFSDNSSNAALGTDAAGSNNWTVNNLSVAASTKATPGTFSGKDGISFNGTDAEITLSSDADLNPGNGVFTLECYAYAASGGNAELGIYDGSPGGHGSLVIRRVGSGTLMVERHNTAFDVTGAAFSEDTWHHVAVTRDSSNNVRLFVDGNQSGSTSTGNTHNYQGTFRLGRTNNAFTNGYISNLRLIKGTCLYTGNFTAPTGNLTNVTNTKLLMAQSTTSATAATVKPSGVTISGPGDGGVGIDSLIDTPTNYTAASGNNGGNYCTLNPLDRQSTNGTLSNGNLDLTSTGANWAMYRGTIFVSSGKWYWECTLGNNQYSTVGICTDEYNIGSQTNAWVNHSTEMFGYYPYNGSKYNGSSGVSYATGDTSASGSVIGVALDMDNGTLTFYKDGTSLGTAYTGLTGKNVSPTHWVYQHSGVGNADSYNFGQRPFAYTPPSGFLSLCTTNLPDPTIADGSTAFDVATYSGNSSTQNITGLNLSPDFLWIKSRSSPPSGAYHHFFDIVRGKSSGFFSSLHSNTTEQENTYPGSTYGGVTSFNSDGFTLSNTGGSTFLNTSSHTYVAWVWDAGTSTASNTDGSITSQVRANASAGFSIVTASPNQQAESIGHGLGATPRLIISKSRTVTDDWTVYHSSVGADYILRLNDNSAKQNVSGFWGTINNSTFAVSAGNRSHNSGNMVYYCFAPVAGYSAFGSYTGNGSADGPFVYTGFRPRFILRKQTNSAQHWHITDTARDPENAADSWLFPNLSDAEGSGDIDRHTDILSNGFKVRSAYTYHNQSGSDYLYIAFAEHPFATARAR